MRTFITCFRQTALSVTVICSDTFGYACADAEEIPADDFVKLWILYPNEEWTAQTAYIALKRKMEPLEQLRTNDYQRIKAELQNHTGWEGLPL